MIKKLILYTKTVSYLSLEQIFWQVYYRVFKKTKIKETNMLPNISNINSHFTLIKKPQRIFGINKFVFLNEEHIFKKDIPWNALNINKLWLYNLHYFDDLNCDGGENRVELHKYIINKWVMDNKVGFGNGWEPYTLSLRIVNWIKWSLQGNELGDSAKISLYNQVRYLRRRIEYHLRGNHIIANAKALIFAGIFFAGDEPKSWFAKGWDILSRELPEQVLPDGANFELSPMYHAIFLEDILDLINISRMYNADMYYNLEELSSKMYRWLSSMTHPNGELSLFNDCAQNISLTTKQISDYFNLLGIPYENVNGSIYNEASGYVRISSSDCTAILDIANIGPDYIPGHGHADTFSFEMSLGDHKLIVNSGTSMYGISAERVWQRGTAAHSTLLIDNKNSSEVWSGFRVAGRAKVVEKNVEISIGAAEISAVHNGFSKLRGKPLHSRKWVFEEGGVLLEDSLISSVPQKAQAIFYLAPECKILEVADKLVLIKIGVYTVEMMFISSSAKIRLEESFYHPDFGGSKKNWKIVVSFNSNIDGLRTHIRWNN